MWLLSPSDAANSSKCIVLLAGTEHVVGRKDCAVLIQDDPSISRKHGVITVQHSEDNLGDPNKLSKVFLEDLSKYGTFLNGNKVSGTVNLKSGDKILFGKNNSSYSLNYSPLVVVTSCLEEKKKKLLRSNILKLGGHMINDWRPDIVTHLVMDGLTFTIKVIHALAGCCSIVTPSYFDDVLTTESTLPPVERYLPVLKEETIASQDVSFLPKEARRTLFKGKTFMFISKKQYKRVHHAVESGGGTAILRDSQGSETDSGLVSSDVCVMMVDPKEHNALPAVSQQWITHVVEILRRDKRRPIPESELGLVLLFMSLDKYCNPSINAVPLLTQNLVSQSFQAAENMSQRICSEQFIPQETPFKKPVFPVKHTKETKTTAEDTCDQQKKISAAPDVETTLKQTSGKRLARGPPVANTVPDTQDDSQSAESPAKRRKITPGEISEPNKNREELANKRKEDLKLEIADSIVGDASEMKLDFDSELDTEVESQGMKQKVANKVEIVADSMDINEDNHVFVEGSNDDTRITKEKKCEFSVNKVKEAEIRGEQSVGLSWLRVNQDNLEEGEAEGTDKELTNGKRLARPLRQQRDVESEAFDSVQVTELDVPTGFLCTRLPRKINKNEVFEEESSFPRNLVVLDQTSLVVKRPAATRNTENRTDNNAVKDFKKFRKQLYPGSGLSLPRIIGGSDLTLYQPFERLDKDEWFQEAREADAERQREEQRAEDLFRWEGRPTGGKRARK